jgi:glycosyltransferase involved in cell wall biosynthesis
MKLMRLAIFGHVVKDSGSSPSGFYLLVESLLRRGHEIDFYAIKNFATPYELTTFPNLRVIEVEIAWSDRMLDFLVSRPSKRIAYIVSRTFNHYRAYLYNRRLAQAIRLGHRKRFYDLVLVLDRLSPFPKWPDLPCVSWPQGSPLAELEPVQRLRHQVIQLCGWTFYLGFTLYYHWRIWLARGEIKRTTLLLCGSQWSRKAWQRLGARREKVFALPLAVDLDRFSPPPAGAAGNVAERKTFRFLHLGRIVPRKRADLLLEGFRLLRQGDPDVRLVFVGDVQAAEGYGKFFEDPDLIRQVEFLGRVERARVPDLLRSVDVVIQTSENENFGAAVMEALACGIPVIVGPTNGTGDFRSARSIVFKDYTREAVYEAMKTMKAACLQEGAEIRAEARCAAEKFFSADVVVDHLLPILESAVGGPAERGRQEN